MSFSTVTTPQKVVLGSSGRIAQSAQVTHGSPARILIIEDEVRFAEFVRDALTEIGYAVAVARMGRMR